jgi:hypothetical protein
MPKTAKGCAILGHSRREMSDRRGRTTSPNQMTPPSGPGIAIGVALVMFWGVALVDWRPVGAFRTVNACADYRRFAQSRG